MSTVASQITGVSIIYSTVCSSADQRKHESSVSLALVRGSHRWPVNSPSQRASYAGNVSIWWRHHECVWLTQIFDWHGVGCLAAPTFRYVHTCAGGRGRRRAEAGGKLASTQIITCVREHMRGRGAGAKSAPQKMGPTPNLPRPLRNRALQTIIFLKKWQVRPRPLRVYVWTYPR